MGSTIDQTARELVFLAGPEDAWLLSDDDWVDPVAIAVAAEGIRRVRLTLSERLAAALTILSSGGSVHSVCIRLGLPDGTEYRWQQLQGWADRRASALAIPALAIGIVIQQSFS